MPQPAYAECRFPRCPNYAVNRGYCATHADLASEQLRGPQRGSLAPNNRRFRVLRASFLLRHPVCAICAREPASILDHIIAHRGDARLFWSQLNWQGTCVTCHGRKTARETWGQDG